jgi:hypothetical protein
VAVRDGSAGAEEPGKAEAAPTASLNGMKAYDLNPAHRSNSELLLVFEDSHIITRLRLAYPLRCRGY